MSAEERLQELGLELPPPPNAVGVYQPALTIDRLCYTSGHLPLKADGTLFKGCVGREVDVATGHAAAKQAGLAMLSSLRQHLGSLDRVEQVVKLFGMVYCTSEFTEQPAVINGCSELMDQVFSPKGVGTRSAVGVASLPLGVSVEIEGIFLLKQD